MNTKKFMLIASWAYQSNCPLDKEKLTGYILHWNGITTSHLHPTLTGGPNPCHNPRHCLAEDLRQQDLRRAHHNGWPCNCAVACWGPKVVRVGVELGAPKRPNKVLQTSVNTFFKTGKGYTFGASAVAEKEKGSLTARSGVLVFEKAMKRPAMQADLHTTFTKEDEEMEAQLSVLRDNMSNLSTDDEGSADFAILEDTSVESSDAEEDVSELGGDEVNDIGDQVVEGDGGDIGEQDDKTDLDSVLIVEFE